MAVTTADFSTITNVIFDGVEMDNLYLDDVKRWGRYLVDEVYQEWISSGYTQTTTNNSGWKYTYNKYGWQEYKVLWNGSNLGNHSSTFSSGGYTYYKGSAAYQDYEANATVIYYIRRTWVSSAWVDTSHYEDATRQVYAYYY